MWKKWRDYGLILLVCTLTGCGVEGDGRGGGGLDDGAAVSSGPSGFFDVGGHRLFLECVGSGSPTLILDHGQGTSAATWEPIWSELTRMTRACRYDRAGRGQSEQGPVPTSSARIVEHLHRLLSSADVPPPYVVVGHSLGGLNAQVFAMTYPDEVEGLVLIDPSSRFYDLTAVNPGDFPIDTVEHRMLSDFLLTANSQTYLDSPEGVDWSVSYDEARALTTLGDLPVQVLTAGDRTWTAPTSFPSSLKGLLAEVWLGAQREIVALSSRSTHVIAAESGHFVHVDRPDLVLEAVESILSDVSGGGN